MPNTVDQAWHKGYNAGANRQPENSNPYRKGMVFHAWLEGWRKGMDPDHDERDRD